MVDAFEKECAYVQLNKLFKHGGEWDANHQRSCNNRFSTGIKLYILLSVTHQSLSVSVICRPKDLLSLIHGELAAIEGTCTLATLINLIDTFAAEHVPAREEHLHVVPILRATPASHLWLP